MNPQLWPVLTRYDENHLARIALPLGGIGTGTVSLGGRGDLRDWEIVNRPAKGFTPENGFFALRVGEENGREIVTRCLEGPLDPGLYEGGFGSPARNHGLPRFRQCAFEAAYPFGQVVLSDPGVPVLVRLQAFNPLVPGDADRSGIPVAILRYVLTNTSAETLTATVCGSLKNFIGDDGTTTAAKENRTAFQQGSGLAGLVYTTTGVEPEAETWGTMALTVMTPKNGSEGNGVSYRTAWAKRSWGDALLDFWDDLTEDGRLEDRNAEGVDSPIVRSLNRSRWLPAKPSLSRFCSHGGFPTGSRGRRTSMASNRRLSGITTRGNTRTPGTRRRKRRQVLTRWKPIRSLLFLRSVLRICPPRSRKPRSTTFPRCEPRPCFGRPTDYYSGGKAAAIRQAAATEAAPTSGTTRPRRLSCSATWPERCAKSSWLMRRSAIRD